MLNSSYEPIKIISWQKAILLWFHDKVEVIEHHEVSVRSVSKSFRLPSVIRLKKYVRGHRLAMIRFSRENVYRRDNYACQYCHKPFSARELTLDHVLPVSRGGRKNWHNVVAACKTCNQRKANRTPEQANMPLKTLPGVPQWLPEVQFQIDWRTVPEEWRTYLSPLTLSLGTPF